MDNLSIQIFTNTGSDIHESSKTITVRKQVQTVSSTEGRKADILFVTSNPGKLREVRQILGTEFPVRIEAVAVDLDEIQHEDPDVIAVTKCKEAADQLQNQPLLIEDTCLSFNALGGLPGPYIKWFEKKIGNEGLVHLLDGFDDKRASAIASFSFWDGEKVILFRGIADGTIVNPRHGSQPAFGWDPIFLPTGSDQTFAEMGADAKNLISHRVRALTLFKEHIRRDRPN